MNEVDQAKLLAALLGVLKKENSKAKKALAEELSQELQHLIDDQSGTKYLQIDELDNPIPIQVFRGEKGDKGPKGPNGSKGEKGSRGISGPQGPQGLSGPTGPMGPQGLTGPEGKQGPKGDPGKDGVSPDIEPFKTKIISDFDQFTKNISSQITRMAYAGGGGGSAGSGEVRLLRLDDVDTSSLGDQRYLRYNATTEKLEFTSTIVSANSVSQEDLDNYLQVANANFVTQDQLDNYLQVANAIAGTITQDNLDRYLQVANSVLFVTQSDLDAYLQVANANFITQNILDGYLQVANANFVTQSTLDGYLQVANAVPLIQDKVDKYLQVSNANFVTQSTLDGYLEVANTGDFVLRPELDNYLQVANLNFEAVNSNIVPAANNTYSLGTPDKRWKELYISGNTVYIGTAQLKVDDVTGSVAIVPDTQSGSNTNAIVITQQGALRTAAVAANGSVSRADFDKFAGSNNQTIIDFTQIGSNAAPSVTDQFNLGNTNRRWKNLHISGSVFINGQEAFNSSTLDNYLQVSNANVIIQDKVDKYLQVSNTGAFVIRSELDNYLEVSNSITFTTQSDLDKYLQVSNANFVTQNQLDNYLQVANANFVTQDTLDNYLQVANAASGSITQGDLDRYLQVANANFIVSANNIGLGANVYASTINNILQLRKIRGGSNVSVEVDSDGIVISSSAGGAAVSGEFDYGLITSPVTVQHNYGTIN